MDLRNSRIAPLLRPVWRLGLRAAYPGWLLYLGLDRLLGHWLSKAWMRRDWDERARRNARFYVALNHDKSEKEYLESGERDVADLIESRLGVLLPSIDPKQADVLEIGCGTGRMTRPMSQLFGRLTALDVSAEMVAQAQVTLRDCDNVSFLVGNGIDLTGLRDEAFDLVLCLLVFQHIPDKAIVRSYFRETARVLRQGGAFFFQVRTPLPSEGHLLWRPRDTWIGALHSPGEVRELAQRCGLQLEECWGEGTSSLFGVSRKSTTIRSVPRSSL